jgi:hypothetical protein
MVIAETPRRYDVTIREKAKNMMPLKATIAGVILGVAALLVLGSAKAHDPDHHEHAEWYQSLMQPDNPNASCCGKADAYWADEIHVRNGKTYATITDDRPDEPRGRPHVDVGTEIEIPDNKLKWDKSNPTGHGVVFLSRAGYVYCFVQPGGV